MIIQTSRGNDFVMHKIDVYVSEDNTKYYIEGKGPAANGDGLSSFYIKLTREEWWHLKSVMDGPHAIIQGTSEFANRFDDAE